MLQLVSKRQAQAACPGEVAVWSRGHMHLSSDSKVKDTEVNEVKKPKLQLG